MRLRTIGLAAALSAALFQTSSAVVRPKGADEPVVAVGKAPRMNRATAWSRDSELAAVGLPGWKALWDTDTGVPVRLWGPAPFHAGAMADGAIAEAAARQFLAEHIRLLAPGAQLSDFVLVSNQLGGSGGDVRSLGFQQMASGVEVLGASVSFAFKNDRMIMVGSTAMPDVHVEALPPTRLTDAELGARATGWLASEGFATAAVKTNATRVIVPIVHTRTGAARDIEYRLAEQVLVESTQDEGRWNVWLEAASGNPILRRSLVQYASGKILFNVPDRHPSGSRSGRPAPRASHTVNGVATVAETDGTVTWASGGATVAPGLTGPFVTVSNKGGALATDSLSLADGGTVTWSKSTDEYGDAQLSSFVFASQVRTFVHDKIDPTLAWADTGVIPVNVNINQTCNANYNGSSINFYRATTQASGTQCENTGRIADVVYHEYGHSVHHHALIPGVGMIDGGVGEGVADILAALVTRDHGMGRGFFFNDQPLRDLDSAQTMRYPDDLSGEVHNDGEIVGQAFWDMKKELVAKLGAEPAELQARKLYYGIIQRSVDIPTTYIEALVADDNDGDLTNGTPNICAINAGYAAHGLADVSSSLGLSTPVREDYAISFTARPASGATACPGAPSVSKANIAWRKKGGEVATVDLAVSGDTYSGKIPSQPDGTVVQYQVVVTLSDGSTISYPNNKADPFYEFYVGPVTKLWCQDFENGAAEWTHGAQPTNRDEWQAGAPKGLGGDPKAAFAGNGVFGTDLMNDGQYRQSSTSWAETPEIDLAGNTNVRLQYYRWLTVEDGWFDNATISANGTKVWTNFASSAEPTSSVNHMDKEWRFQDVDLSAQASTGKMKLRFEVASDPGFNAGGWTLDELCIVAAAPAPTCGNGKLDEGETCDDGNIDDGDGCSPTCGVPGSDETGCCSVGATPGGAALLSLFTIGMLIRRRRR